MALNLSAEIVKGRNHTSGITTIIALQLRHPALELTWLACAGIGMPRASSSYKGAPRVLVVRSPMGSWWRSRDMKYVSLILSEDAAHECVHNLGELSALQFTDLNPEQTAFQRRYVNYVKR